MGDANWDICFICQVSSKDNIHSSTDGTRLKQKIFQSFTKKESLVSILREFITLIRTYNQFWQQIKQFISTIVSQSISIRNWNTSTSHLKSGNLQKLKREESQHVCQLNQHKDLIYSVVGVAKRMLILISSLDMNISGNKINHEIKSHERFNFKMDRNGH